MGSGNAGGRQDDPQDSVTPASGQAAHRASVRRAAGAADGLVAGAAEIATDLDGLPLFVRAMARRAFQSRSGKSVAEWKALAERLRDRLKALAEATESGAAGPSTEGPAAYLGEFAGLDESLANLDGCLAAAPSQAALFSQDAGLLRVVDEKTARQRAAIAGLRAALANLRRP